MIPSVDIAMVLAPGDRMELKEFLERWDQLPDLKFAELIDGVVYMPSPLPHPHGLINNWAQYVCRHYVSSSGVCECVADVSWILLESAPQPDLALYLKPEYGGKMKIAPRELASGIPELIVEVCKSSRAYDLGSKLGLYQRAGVPEYLAVLVEEQRFEWRILTHGRYQLLQAANGIFRSRAWPGLWLDEQAFWKADGPRPLAVLEEGLNSPEFLEFKQRLKPASE